MPNLYLIGGPNGAGKTTIALRLFPDILTSKEFVNADFIARGLSAFNTESVAFTAGRLMLERLHELKSQKKDFAFETTLASRFLVPFLKECKRERYSITLVYVWVESADLAIERIRKRVREGEHSIPDEVVRRRYGRSISNLFNLYKPLVDEWRIYDNTFAEPSAVQYKELGKNVVTLLPERMERIMKSQIREPAAEYVASKIDLAVKAAVVEELDRKWKLGLPIVVGGGDRVLVMLGDKVVEEIPYSMVETSEKSSQHHGEQRRAYDSANARGG